MENALSYYNAVSKIITFISERIFFYEFSNTTASFPCFIAVPGSTDIKHDKATNEQSLFHSLFYVRVGLFEARIAVCR